ncbi:MAG TPA: AraC family transcriptional regulator [Aliidongia sp.]|uniref:AraC family transcriptional regulator n=1 Tax=Aliidongia sp. TaxID=1914230 RepID=UPI002DDD07AA|nr:AraC family transcriptional regulator [Aliidongia sp.]HEV2675442.1 AraC family transcriptional regulator [Aliidongia sp.]
MERAVDWAEYATAPEAGVELLRARMRRHVYERHAHDGYAIGITEWGVQAFRCRGAAHASTPGMVMAFNPDEPHDGHAGDPGGFVYRMLYVAPEAMRAVLDECADRPAPLPFFATPLIVDEALGLLIARTHALLAAPSSRLERDAGLTATIRRLAGHGGGIATPRSPGRHDRALGRVRDRLHADAAEEIATDELARLADMNRFQLCRQFHQRYGLPPHAYQLRLRLAAARRLLAEGEPAAQVAAAVGFVDQSHLNRRFKGAFGITPVQFARAAQAGTGPI